MAYFTNSQGYLFLCSNIVFEGTGFLIVYKKKLELFLSLTIKAIPSKVFGRWGRGREPFFKKVSSPQNIFATAPFLQFYAGVTETLFYRQ